jgi:hypothetical protein
MSTLYQREREFDLYQRILRVELSLRRDPIKQGLVTRKKYSHFFVIAESEKFNLSKSKDYLNSI